jgi:cytochrome c biogenesis protein CcdA
MKPVNSFSDFKSQLESDSQLQSDFKNDPVKAIGQFNENPLNSDKLIYRIVVFALGFTIVAIVLGVLMLMSTKGIKEDKDIPTIITAIGSASIGALAGLLAPPPPRG